jgi:hypothetical protein
VCGVCWPVDLDDPIDWATVPIGACRGRSADPDGHATPAADYPEEAV